MELNPQTINEILEMYVRYCKELQLTQKPPVLTLNESEYDKALINPEDKERAFNNLKKIDALGQTSRLSKINKDYNDIVFVNADKMTALKGLHERIERLEKKRIHTWRMIHKIGHLEETLIHELVHVKYPKLRHGKRFQQIVTNIYLKYNSDNQ